MRGSLIQGLRCPKKLRSGWSSSRGQDQSSFDEIASLDAPAMMGTCQTVMPSGPWAHPDEASTLDVLLDPEDEIEAVSEAEMLAGANAALVGDEIIGFRDAAMIARGA